MSENVLVKGRRRSWTLLGILIGWTVAAGGVPSVAVFAAEDTAADPHRTERPNIVFLLADDLGYGDLGCYGREDIRTPRLDELARQGTKFTAHYANGPECTPTRAAFLTGRYQQWIGGLECAIGTGNLGRYDDAMRLRETNDLGLPTEQKTIVRLLKDAGYRTGMTGKWHLGYEPKFAPHLHGFDTTYYCIGGEMDYFHYLDPVAGYNLFRDGRPIRDEGYFTDRIIDEAVEFVGEEDPRPFFLYVPFTTPHAPYQSADDRRPHPLPLDSPLWKQSAAPPATYIAMIERMDEQIGRLLDELDRRSIRDETLVVFASDNGGTKSGRNSPYSGYKGSTFEGGIRVPLILRWPGHVPAGRVSDQPSITFDLTRSMANLGGVPADRFADFEGLDIVDHVVSGRDDLPRTLFWRKPRGTTIWKGVREGDWKYVAENKGGKETPFLFNLADDPSETRDLSERHVDRISQMKARFDAWEQRTRRNRRGRGETGDE